MAMASQIKQIDLPTQVISAIYTGPIGQQVFDQMQTDKIAQSDLFGDGFTLIPTDVERCMEWRENYYNDMREHEEEFERFEENFSFSKPYASEDPIESFKRKPSKAAYDAFMQF